MSDIGAQIVREARHRAGLTQRALGDRVGTSQAAIARVEAGSTNPTVDTLVRYAEAAGFGLRLQLVVLPSHDPVVERYKQDVDRTLLRENRRKSVDERLRTLGEWQEVGRELQRVTRAVRQKRR